MSVADLTDEEERAIASLERLAKRWPKTLKLFSWSGSLVVLHAADTERLGEPESQGDVILAQIAGIPNDGGDP